MSLIKNKKNNKKGFSIGEVVLSIFILGVTMLTIMTVLSISLKDMMDERDSIIATMLAQEGVELARSIRDNNWSQRTATSTTTPGTFDNFRNNDNNSCRIYYSSTDLNTCNSGLNMALYYNAGFYDHSGAGTETKFRRRIILDYGPDPANATNAEYLIITSVVSWDNSNPPTSVANCTVANKCVYSNTILYNWGTAI